MVVGDEGSVTGAGALLCCRMVSWCGGVNEGRVGGECVVVAVIVCRVVTGVVAVIRR